MKAVLYRLLPYPVPGLQVPPQKSSVSECSLTFPADERLVRRSGLDVVRLVVESVVSDEELLLPEGPAALPAQEGLQTGVLEIVTLQVLPDRGPVAALRARQVLLSSVRPLVELEAVSVSKLFAALAEVLPVSAVLLLQVELEVCLPAERAVTESAGDDVPLLGVDLGVTLQRVALIESLWAVAALVGPLSCMNSQVSLQFEGVL